MSQHRKKYNHHHRPLLRPLHTLYCSPYHHLNLLFVLFGDDDSEIVIVLGEVQPHFCPWEKCVFSHFSPWRKWEKKYMEKEGKVFISLSFHILFSHGGKWEKTQFSHGQKWGWTPQCCIGIVGVLHWYSWLVTMSHWYSWTVTLV